MSKQKKTYYSLRSFFSYMARFKWRFALVITCYAIADLLLVIIPVFIGKLIGALTADPVQQDEAILYVWILIFCSTGHNLLWRASELMYMRLLNPVAYRYENILFKYIVRKPYPYFVDKFTGKLSSYINTISEELRGLIENICYEYTNQVVSIVAIAVILTSINWQTGAIFAVGVLGMYAVGRHTIRNSSRYEKIAADTVSTKNGKIIDAIANFVNVKSFQKEEAEIAAIEIEQTKTVKDANKSFFWSIVFWGSMSFFVRDLIWPATIALNVYLFLQGDISIAALTTVLSTVLLFSSTIWEMIWQISQFNLKLARTEEAHLYLFGKTNVVHEDDAARRSTAAPMPLETGVEFCKLNFAYPDKPDTAVLQNIDLYLKKGEKLGIVGRSGSGKSTLTKLLLGYYPVPKGEILLDGQVIDTRDLARLVSYVPQDTSLFHRSVAENIAYASDSAVSQEQIVHAARQAHADEFIRKITNGYDALVGERGVKLSAGQRQRIAIARAFLDNKPLLILDEATSALDSESEVLVQEALEALWEHKTVIAIAHRLSTLRHMDRILVIDDGKIVEQGNHRELVNKPGGAYAKLWAHQSGGFIDD
jgi:ABC-type multidrug transport system fused ATPase/permease subunit